MTTTTREVTPGFNCRVAIFFQTDKNGRKCAYYWSGRLGDGRAIRMKLTEAENLVAQGQADLLPCHPLKAAMQEPEPVVEEVAKPVLTDETITYTIIDCPTSNGIPFIARVLVPGQEVQEYDPQPSCWWMYTEGDLVNAVNKQFKGAWYLKPEVFEQRVAEQQKVEQDITPEQLAEIMPFAQEYAAHKQADRETFEAETMLETVPNYTQSQDRESISIKAGYSIKFFWRNRWISHESWRYAEALRHAEKLQARNITCQVEQREYGHRGYWQIVCDDSQTETMLKAQEEDHQHWLEGKEAIKVTPTPNFVESITSLQIYAGVSQNDLQMVSNGILKIGDEMEQERQVVRVEKKSDFSMCGTSWFYAHPECFSIKKILQRDNTDGHRYTTLSHREVGSRAVCSECGVSVHEVPVQQQEELQHQERQETTMSNPETTIQLTLDDWNEVKRELALLQGRVALLEASLVPPVKQEQPDPLDLNELRQMIYVAEASLQDAIEALEPVYKDHVLQRVVSGVRSAINDLDSMREMLPEQSEIMVYIEKAVASALIDDGTTPAGVYVDEKYKEELQNATALIIQGQDIKIDYQSEAEMDGELVTAFHEGDNWQHEESTNYYNNLGLHSNLQQQKGKQL